MNASLRTVSCTALAAALALAAAAHAAPKTDSETTPVFTLEPAEIAADSELTWHLQFKVRNPRQVGAYLDSMFCLMEDQDPGEFHAERQHTVPVSSAVTAIQAVSAGDSAEFLYNSPAAFERGRLTFRLYGHFGDGAPYVTSAGASAVPGPVSTAHPSATIDVGGKKVECVFFAPSRSDPAPGVLLVHGDGSNARKQMAPARALAGRGFAVMLVSLPGYGASDGPADMSGPRTLAALGAALDRLERSPGVDRARVGGWGVDRGASALASLAARRTDLAAAVVQSGIYDLWAVHRGSASAALRQAIAAEAGTDSSAWRDRSPLVRAGSIHTPLLVLHGEDDEIVPVAQARAFAAAVEAAGTTVETKIVPKRGHEVPPGDANRAAFTFLAAKLGH